MREEQVSSYRVRKLLFVFVLVLYILCTKPLQ